MSGSVDDRKLPRGVTEAPAGPVEVYFDGACEKVAGRAVAGYGYTLFGAGFRHDDFGLAVPPGHPRATNNVAEYVGAICALEWLARAGYTGEVKLAGDSQLVIRQMTGEYRVLAEHLKPYHERLRQLVGSFRGVAFRWVPRTENARADALSKKGIGRALASRRPGGSPPRDNPSEEPEESEADRADA